MSSVPTDLLVAAQHLENRGDGPLSLSPVLGSEEEDTERKGAKQRPLVEQRQLEEVRALTEWLHSNETFLPLILPLGHRSVGQPGLVLLCVRLLALFVFQGGHRRLAVT